MRIAIDVDDVLANFLPTLVKFHNKTYNTAFTKEHFKSFHLWETWGGTREEAMDKVFHFYETPEFENISVVEGAKEAVKLLKQNHELMVVTARPEELRSKTEAWINIHFPGLFSDIHIANRFSKSGPQTTKAILCETHGAEMLIDDSIDYALECVAPHRRILLFDNPWNQRPELPEGVNRVRSWEEILKQI